MLVVALVLGRAERLPPPPTIEAVRVVGGRETGTAEPPRAAGPTAAPAASAPATATVVEEEPIDPTLYSDDEPWGNSWTAVDGVVQPPRPGRPSVQPADPAMTRPLD